MRPVEILRRWEDSGAIWRVLSLGPPVTVGLYQCTGGEEVDRLTSADPELLRFLADRAGDADPCGSDE
ncbi:hypothetical protein [Nocardia acidivorans]|uniref:hypothetical protein n=1 Tax=Nocardia acidivorans TaxID=404580 RepID=UPI0008307BD4|nr:hypothetical protein [Nocardia acidivorans]